MTLLILLAAATGAGFIAANFGTGLGLRPADDNSSSNISGANSV